MKQVQLSLFGDSFDKPNLKRDLVIGKKFNKLKIIEYHGRDKWGKQKYKCVCDCGNIYYASLTDLRKGYKKSCGCWAQEYRHNGDSRLKDLAGKQFGNLTAIEPRGKDNKGMFLWVCRCICGKKIIKNGHHLRYGTTKLHCGCLDIGKLRRKFKIKKPIDWEQYAKDLYCYYLDGETITDISKGEGYRQETRIINLFMDYITGYRENSILRRENSKWINDQKRSKTQSKIFKYEKDFQQYCSDILSKAGIKNTINDKTITGMEIDIYDGVHCIECKINTRKKSIYSAIGQLVANTSKGLRPVLLIPSDCIINENMEKVLYERKIIIANEYNILNLLQKGTWRLNARQG